MADTAPKLARELRLRDLVLFNISAIAGVRWLAAAAHAGPGSITLWIVAVLFFFLPSAFVVSALSRRFPEEGGLYIWAREAFGPWHGFLCAWFYLTSNLIYFPTLVLAIVSMAAYMFGASSVAETRQFAIPVTLLVLWVAFLGNLFGMRFGKWASNAGGLSTWVIATLLAAFALLVALRFGSATRFNIAPMVNWGTVNLWSQIAFAFAGLELGAILGGEIRNPDRTIPLAAWISGAICTGFYIAGTAALLILIKPEQISVLTGLTQAGQIAGQRLGAWWLSPTFALLVTIGGLGQLWCYVAGSTRLPLAIGIDRFLPPVFARLHPRWHTPHVSILTQGAIATVLLFSMEWGETLRGAYQTLVDMCVITTLLPFIYIFGAGIRFGKRISGVLGLATSAIALVVSVVPPAEVHNRWAFELKLVGGCIFTALLGWLVFTRSRAAYR